MAPVIILLSNEAYMLIVNFSKAVIVEKLGVKPDCIGKKRYESH